MKFFFPKDEIMPKLKALHEHVGIGERKPGDHTQKLKVITKAYGQNKGKRRVFYFKTKIWSDSVLGILTWFDWRKKEIIGHIIVGPTYYFSQSKENSLFLGKWKTYYILLRTICFIAPRTNTFYPSFCCEIVRFTCSSLFCPAGVPSKGKNFPKSGDK